MLNSTPWLVSSLICTTFMQYCRKYNKGSASCIIMALNKNPCIGALTPVLGSQNAYLHFHVTYSLMHISIVYWLNCKVFYYSYCVIIFEVPIIESAIRNTVGFAYQLY